MSSNFGMTLMAFSFSMQGAVLSPACTQALLLVQTQAWSMPSASAQ